jgi:hypothetical protein
MNPRAALSYALKPGVNLRQDCARADLSAADVLVALGWATARHHALVPGFEGLAAGLLRVKWARQMDHLTALHGELVRFALWNFGRKHWAVHDRQQASAMETMRFFAARLIVEFDDPACATCRGRGNVVNQRGIPVVCTACNGVARELQSTSERARALDMHHSCVSDTWGKRLDFVLDEVREIERQALVRISGFLQEI